jgi:hypothetical protein
LSPSVCSPLECYGDMSRPEWIITLIAILTIALIAISWGRTK